MSHHVYEDLLVRFKDAYAKFDLDPFFLYANSREQIKEYDGRGLLLNDKVGSILGYVPVTDDSVVWEICSSNTWGRLTEQPEYLSTPFAVYRQLITQAGAHLPAILRDAVPHRAGCPASDWLALIWSLEPPCDFDVSDINSGGGVFSHTPFRQSADIIERCALNTQNPHVPPRGLVLSERKYLILRTLLDLDAVGADKRHSTAEIAKRAEGNAVNSNNFKDAIAELSRDKLVATKIGSGGGCWLTPTGRLALEKR